MMEPWPVLAWVLLLTNIADWLTSVQSRDFTMKDIIRLHPSTTPHPGGFKCFTCQDAADNYECNRWAPDVYCPKDTSYCYTRHMMDSRGNSVSVTKRCVTLKVCLFTGCTDDNYTGYQICASCCEGNICNLLVPRNESGATFSTVSPLVGSEQKLHPSLLTYVFVMVAGWI
ncbi:ly6/PLAUR domain-containing protein 6 [Genypterus blacodes]|uniref:ly6/PLAUR domain-containing protein 6 n=1 Tax=Genypterus blacodes TaxID=154954 RepID=UPI003F75EAE1